MTLEQSIAEIRTLINEQNAILKSIADSLVFHDREAKTICSIADMLNEETLYSYEVKEGMSAICEAIEKL